MSKFQESHGCYTARLCLKRPAKQQQQQQRYQTQIQKHVVRTIWMPASSFQLKKWRRRERSSVKPIVGSVFYKAHHLNMRVVANEVSRTRLLAVNEIVSFCSPAPRQVQQCVTTSSFSGKHILLFLLMLITTIF